MRMAVLLTLFAAIVILSPGTATALPGALADQAATSRDLGDVALEPVAHRAKGRHKRYAKRYPRRYDWSYYPYWRPYQYRYWKFYYPYGGPLF